MALDDLKDMEDGTTSTKRRYVQPDREDVERCLQETGLSWELVDHPNSHELVYDCRDVPPSYNGIVLRLYSTIDQSSEKARGKGADAMRLVIWDKHVDAPIGGREKTLRIETWCKNLKAKVFNLQETWESYVKECPECGDVLLIRDGQYGEFLGCRNFPNCDHTEELPEEA